MLKVKKGLGEGVRIVKVNEKTNGKEWVYSGPKYWVNNDSDFKKY